MFEPDDFSNLAKRLFPFCRSITGNGVRQTFEIVKEYIPELCVYEIPTGTDCFDWTVPKEWNVNDAYIITPEGKKICEFSDTNLHLLNYSSPICKTVSLEELQDHLYSRPDMPDAIPYVTSYYQERWGFCLSDEQRNTLTPGNYYVHIDTNLFDGHLTLADVVFKGQTDEEILVSTYTCHPSMGNNETSGIVLGVMLAKWISQQTNLRYSYRFVFAPETIGPLVYMKDRLPYLIKNVKGAFNLTCVGDERTVSFLPSKYGDTITDKVALHVLKHSVPDFTRYSFTKDRGSDENQYAAPGVDLPIVSIMRTRYGSYPEYHTSKDDLSLISGKGLSLSFALHIKCFDLFEKLHPLQSTVIGEPWYSKHGLRSTVGAFNLDMDSVIKYANIMTYADGRNNLLDVAEKLDVPVWELYQFYNDLMEAGLLKTVSWR